MSDILLGLALASVGVYIIFAIMIVQEVSKRGVKISFLWLRLYLIKYIHEYKRLTKKETGKVGPLYYPCIISAILALILAITGLILRQL